MNEGDNPFQRAWKKVFDIRRRFLGSFTFDDPRPIARDAPYTFFLPDPAELDALASGDLVKLIFRGHPPSRTWDAERMWVRLAKVDGHHFVGELASQPSDMPQLRRGAKVAFDRHHIIDLTFEPERQIARSAPRPREYWERCMVDDCVLNEGVAVGYLYREEPDAEVGDETYPDSGWRIRGEWGDETEEQYDARTGSIVALGAVLNRDDSWLHLIDMDVGAAFDRDPATRAFVARCA